MSKTSNHHRERADASRKRARSATAATIAAVVQLLIGAHGSAAGEPPFASLRVLKDAVVAGDEVTIGDVCAIDIEDAAARDQLASIRLIDAPQPGGSRILHADAIRSALRGAGWNVATTTIHGSAQCVLRRPASMTDENPSSISNQKGLRRPSRSLAKERGDRHGTAGSTQAFRGGSPGVRIRGSRSAAAGRPLPVAETLRDAVEKHFAELHRRYGGRVELAFDRASQQSLSLSGPRYSFDVRHTRGDAIGLTSIDVRVLEDGRHAQTIPMAVDVSLRLPVVVATGPVNQDATITRSDVDTVEMTFRRLDRTGLRDSRDAIGRRAKRFVEAGAIIDPSDLEQVPLVKRGQLVTLISQVGSARIVAGGKALEDGLPGQLIRVRSADNRRIEFDAVVTGPGTARIGTTPAGLTQLSYAQGER